MITKLSELCLAHSKGKIGACLINKKASFIQVKCQKGGILYMGSAPFHSQVCMSLSADGRRTVEGGKIRIGLGSEAQSRIRGGRVD